jgi:excisionase family DNA binding protein
MPPAFLSAQELAKRLDLSYGTLLSWAHRGVIPYIRDGRGRYMFNLNSVLKALRQQEPPHESNGRQATPPPANPTEDKTAKGVGSQD